MRKIVEKKMFMVLFAILIIIIIAILTFKYAGKIEGVLISPDTENGLVRIDFSKPSVEVMSVLDYTLKNDIKIVLKEKTENGYDVFLYENGTKNYLFSNPLRICYQPVITEDGSIYFIAADNYLYRYYNNNVNRVFSEKVDNESTLVYKNNKLLFVKQRRRVTVLDLDTNETKDICYGVYPCWGKDENEILFCPLIKERYGISKINLKTKEITNINDNVWVDGTGCYNEKSNALLGWHYEDTSFGLYGVSFIMYMKTGKIIDTAFYFGKALLKWDVRNYLEFTYTSFWE